MIEKIKVFLSGLEKQERIKFLRSLAEIIAAEGRKLSPHNFVWKILPEQYFDIPSLFCEEEEVDPAALHPAFVASVIKQGQLLPAFISPDGGIIDGCARHAILGDQLEYIILPDFTREMLMSVRIDSACADLLCRIADKEGERKFLQKLEVNVDMAVESDSYQEEIRAAAKSIANDLSLPEKTGVYVSLREIEFWRMVVVQAEKKIVEIKQRLSIMQEAALPILW